MAAYGSLMSAQETSSNPRILHSQMTESSSTPPAPVVIMLDPLQCMCTSALTMNVTFHIVYPLPPNGNNIL